MSKKGLRCPRARGVRKELDCIVRALEEEEPGLLLAPGEAFAVELWPPAIFVRVTPGRLRSLFFETPVRQRTLLRVHCGTLHLHHSEIDRTKPIRCELFSRDPRLAALVRERFAPLAGEFRCPGIETVDASNRPEALMTGTLPDMPPIRLLRA